MERPAEPERYGLRADTRALHVLEVCIQCKQAIDGWAFIDNHLALVDTDGFVLFADGCVCDPCAGRDAHGVPNPPRFG